jgi:hypothetical protein
LVNSRAVGDYYGRLAVGQRVGYHSERYSKRSRRDKKERQERARRRFWGACGLRRVCGRWELWSALAAAGRGCCCERHGNAPARTTTRTLHATAFSLHLPDGSFPFHFSIFITLVCAFTAGTAFNGEVFPYTVACLGRLRCERPNTD